MVVEGDNKFGGGGGSKVLSSIDLSPSCLSFEAAALCS